MAKRKNPKELMASRNPLANRTPVTPVDIYSQPPAPVVVAPTPEPEPKKAASVKLKQSTEKPHAAATKETPKKNDAERPLSYSTHLFRHQIKGVKLRAIEQGFKDQEIVQAALEEYFSKHPL